MKNQSNVITKWRQIGFFDNKYLLYQNETKYGDVRFLGFRKGIFETEKEPLILQKYRTNEFILKRGESRIASVIQKGNTVEASFQKSREKLMFTLNKKAVATCYVGEKESLVQILNPDPANNGWATIKVTKSPEREVLDISIFIGLFFKRKIMLQRAYFFGFTIAILLLVTIVSYMLIGG